MSTGFADLPLHLGHVPKWLATLMKKLAKEIVEIIIIEYGTSKFLERLSNPLWFQALNNAIGMDWDSSGSTTVTTAILKEVLNNTNIGVMIAGGKGAISRNTPNEIQKFGLRIGLSSSKVNDLIKISKLSAKVDTALLQDGFTLYHHTLIFDDKGNWVVVQQGMNLKNKTARRYHIAWFKALDITEEPHTGISSNYLGKPLNLLDIRSRPCKKVIIDLLNENPRKVINLMHEVNRELKGIKTLTQSIRKLRINPSIPYYKPIKLTKGLLNKLTHAYEIKPQKIEDALLIGKLGPETFRALSLISELIYREPPSLNDPVSHPYDPLKYAFTVGGKDGIPFPVKRELMISIIKELSEIIKSSKLGNKEKLIALRSLRKYAPKDLII